MPLHRHGRGRAPSRLVREGGPPRLPPPRFRRIVCGIGCIVATAWAAEGWAIAPPAPWPVPTAGEAHPAPSADALLNEAYRLKADGRPDEAAKAFADARAHGASAQLVSMELAYLAVARGEPDEARRLFASAEEGDDPDLRARAGAERAAMAKPAAARPSAASSPVDSTLAEAYRLKSEREFDAAAAAFTRAQAAGADPQRIAMELGYVAAARGSSDDMRTYFSAAANGPDRVIADRAKSEMAYLPRRFWGDLYADAYGWQRAAGEDRGGSLVPTVRVRGMVRPALSLDFNLYIYGQATRDTGSRGSVAGGPPRIFADDYALVGAGAMLRFWGGRIGLFAQIGPAFNLIDDGRERAAVDGRGGGVLYAETSRCAPSPAHGAWAGFLPCLETYAEVVYVSRFDNNVIAFGRPRVAGSYLVTGPVAWQVVAEARAAADRNGDYYNNLVDGGAGHRWRLLAPLRIDALFSVNAGTYFGVTNRDPAPSRLSYADLRLNLATYAEF